MKKTIKVLKFNHFQNGKLNITVETNEGETITYQTYKDRNGIPSGIYKAEHLKDVFEEMINKIDSGLDDYFELIKRGFIH